MILKIGAVVAYIDTDATAPEKSTVSSQQSEEKKGKLKCRKKDENLKSQISNLKSNYATDNPISICKKILDEKKKLNLLTL